VDDGKSTLIGRLLYDSALVPADRIAALARDSKRHGTTGEELDLALLVDGLEAEREQGITIDVAHRFFATPRRAFIVADTPGHEQYTRNMATGASDADLAVLLLDARRGMTTQTRRHAHICALLGIRHVVLAVNKMDLVDFSRDAFERIASGFRTFARSLGFESVPAIPLSARSGENVTVPSRHMAWYDGPPLLRYLETVDVERGRERLPFRFPVQWVNRRQSEFRGYAGTVASGVVKRGDRIAVAGSVQSAATVERIVTFEGDLDEARAGDAVTLTLAEDVDVGRGDVLASAATPPVTVDQFAAHLIWMDSEPLLPGRSYLLRIGTRFVPAQVTQLKHRLDVTTGERLAARTLALNEIGFANLATLTPVALDPYEHDRATGAFVLIDRGTHATVGAGMVAFPLRRATTVQAHELVVTGEARASMKGQTPAVVWFTGLSGSGKSTIANLVERELHTRGVHTYLLDGDHVRQGLNKDLGFTPADRVENMRRIGEVAKLFLDAGLVVICSFISPFRAEREAIRELVGPERFVEIFVDAPFEECARRDPKGLYARARQGELRNFTGVDSPYEAPENPAIRVDTSVLEPADAARAVIALVERIVFRPTPDA
jgi:bifunctional enzyme CysN/CysC